MYIHNIYISIYIIIIRIVYWLPLYYISHYFVYIIIKITNTSYTKLSIIYYLLFTFVNLYYVLYYFIYVHYYYRYQYYYIYCFYYLL